MFFFDDRADAAMQLVTDVSAERFRERETIVMAVSEGSVIIADKLAEAFGADMDMLLSTPVYAPKNPELPIAMVSETKELVINRPLIDSFGIDEDFIYAQAQREYDDKVLGKIYRYRQGSEIKQVLGKTVVLVDECIETGITILMAIKSMISLGAKNVYVAVPILDEAVYDNLIPVCDGVYCPHRIRDYISIEYYYRKLPKLTFEEIERVIKKYEHD